MSMLNSDTCVCSVLDAMHIYSYLISQNIHFKKTLESVARTIIRYLEP